LTRAGKWDMNEGNDCLGVEWQQQKKILVILALEIYVEKIRIFL
jgi:hypothetical protein